MIEFEPISNDQDLIDHDCNYYSNEDFNNKFCSKPQNINTASDNFSLLHINARSLNKNFDSIELFLKTINQFPFSVIGITETWLNSNSPQLFHLQNYELIRADRAHGKGGGVGIYVHDQLKFKRRHDLHIDGTEDLFIEITNNKDRNIIIGTIYRPPNNGIDLFLHNFDEGLNRISQENKYIYLMGDYNIDLLTSIQPNNSRFINILQSNTLFPHINKPTRICNTSQTLIDNIFSNVYCNSVNGIFYSDISDH